MNLDSIRPRWVKLLRDALLEKERVGLMFGALVASLFAVAAILGARSILVREIAANYMSTRPAMATLEMERPIDAGLLDAVRAFPEVAAAEAREVVQARVKVGEDWVPLLVFVQEGTGMPALNRFFPESENWPVATGSLALERTALPVLESRVGGMLEVKFPGRSACKVAVGASVHDPGLSPAFQERMGYAYATTATLRSLGADADLHELRVDLKAPNPTTESVTQDARAVASGLREAGWDVHEVRVPPLGRHPHQLQMETVLLMLLLFAGLGVLLSAVLVATTLSAWLARQTRELAILKTVGASSTQVGGLYLAFVAALGTAAWLVAWPLGAHAATIFARTIAKMLNLGLGDLSIPWTDPVIVALAAVVVPVVMAAFPIVAASRSTVGQSLGDWEADTESLAGWKSRMPSWLRIPMRRPRRFALSLALLGGSGAIFVATLDIRSGWTANLDKIRQTRHYDMEVRFRAPLPDSVLQELSNVPGVVSVESWGWSPAGFTRPGEIGFARTWPDKGHGSLSVMGVPVDTRLVAFPVLQGRWLRETDDSGVVLNHVAWNQAGKPDVGTRVWIGSEGRNLSVRVVGVVEEVGSPGVVYLTRRAFSGPSGFGNGFRQIRVATSAKDASERSTILRALESEMDRIGLPVQMAIPMAVLRTAIGDHMKVLIGALVALAAITGIVGLLGLVSVTGMGVLERAREFAVLKTIGAPPRRIVHMVLEESLVVGAISWLAGCLAALPLTWLMDRIIGSMGFLAPLPFVVDPVGPFMWFLAMLAGSIAAGWIPARRAGRITVREALASL